MTFGIQTKGERGGRIIGLGGSLLVNYQRLLRLAGVTLWLFLLIATRDFPTARDHFYHPHNDTVWFICWTLFGACFWATTSSIQRSHSMTYILIGLETLIALYFAWLQPGSSITFLLVFVAWQIALILPARQALLWIVIQSIAHIVLNEKFNTVGLMDLAQYVVYYSFKTFTCVIVILAKQEAEARMDQAVINGQLEATRELLAENSRSLERLRISRELHDAVGHRLTALYLHLEVARNAHKPEQIHDHVEKAQRVSQELLTDVRDVVRTLRNSSRIDLNGALLALSADLPGLKVHLAAPEHLSLEDSNKAEVLIRCVQEIITNTLKHASATELWITLEIINKDIRMVAHDNGRHALPVRDAGLGLIGMKERFVQYGGLVEVGAEEGSSFSIRALLPLSSPQEQA
jgi:signal transduction histidine kinase